MRIFGLDLGSNSIKAVQLQPERDKYRLLHLGMGAMPASLQSEAESDQKAIAEAIKKVLLDTGIGIKEAIISLPESQVFSRVIELPALSEAELKSAIRWEAEQYIPIPLEEAVVDYQIIRQPEKIVTSGKTEVFLVAAPKSLINKYTRLLQLAGLKAIALETEMVALSRSLVVPGSSPTMIVDLGARATDIAIVEKGQIVLTRSLPSAGEAITRALVAALGLKESQAEEYKKAYGVDKSKLEGKIREAVGPVLDIVIKEINKVISYYQNKNKNTKIERIILAGGTADLPEIVHLFAEKLGIEVQIGNPFQRIEGGKDVLAKLEKRTASLYSVAFGLAMKEI